MEFFIILLVAVVVFGFKSFVVIPQQEVHVVERLGRFHRALTAGLNILIPFIDRVAYRHSLKEIPLDVPSQVCITRDNTQLTVDGIIYFQVTIPNSPHTVRATISWQLPSLPKRRYVPLLDVWSWTKRLKNATKSTVPSSPPSMKPPELGV